jgi:hypothetical protein
MPCGSRSPLTASTPWSRPSPSTGFPTPEPGGRVFIALVNPPFEAISQVARSASELLGEPLDWPTRSRMRRRLEAAGFRVERQQRLFRAPAGLMLPPVLSVGVRPG